MRAPKTMAKQFHCARVPSTAPSPAMAHFMSMRTLGRSKQRFLQHITRDRINPAPLCLRIRPREVPAAFEALCRMRAHHGRNQYRFGTTRVGGRRAPTPRRDGPWSAPRGGSKPPTLPHADAPWRKLRRARNAARRKWQRQKTHYIFFIFCKTVTKMIS